MAYTPPKVFYSATLDGTYTEITGVQAVNISRGRQRASDPFVGSLCTIEIIPANSYATPLAVGQFLDIRDSNSGSSDAYFAGRITDVQRRYEIPYNSSTGSAPADRIYLTVTGGTGVMASSVYEAGEILVYEDVMYAFSFGTNGVYVEYPTVPPAEVETPSDVYQAAHTFSAGTPVMEVKNLQLRTANWVMDDGDQTRLDYGGYDYRVNTYPVNGWGTAVSFVDDGSTGTEVFRYSAIEYLSGAQSDFGRVIVEPLDVATRYAQTSSTSPNALVVSTLDASTTQAQNLADYLLLINTQPTPAPFVLQTSTALSDTVGKLGKFETYPVGTAVTVVFRGSTVFATVQGYSFGYYPDVATVQVFLSPSLGTPFTLDSTAFGVLDTNRLGYP